MIELLVVIALATIGVYFTTTSAESMDRPQVDDDQYDLEAPEDEGGIGILGIDVGRRVKSVRKAGAAARQRVAAIRGIGSARREPEPEVSVDDAIRSVMGSTDGPLRRRSDEVVQAPEVAAVEAREPVTARDETPEPVAAEDTHDRPEEPAPAMPEVAETAMPAPAPQPELDPEDDDTDFDAAIGAAIRAEMAEQESYRTGARTAAGASGHSRRPQPEVPVVEDFDPDEDQIVIGYRRGEAGDGRIGISEDPTSPGTARVTLGGKVVALVPGGYGLVQAYHIELRLIENAA